MKRTAAYPQPRHDAGATRVVGQAGGMLLTKTAVVTGLTHGWSKSLGRWRKPFATHDPGKIVSDLAITLALGGDCLADAALLRPGFRRCVAGGGCELRVWLGGMRVGVVTRRVTRGRCG